MSAALSTRLPDDSEPAARLAAGVQAAGWPVDAAQQARLLAYLALIHKWNRVHNLTAVRDPVEMVTLHLLDSLSVLPYLRGDSLLDVGSGAGLPGIPIALCRPDLRVTVIDSSQKKASFMRQAKAELGIGNLEVVCGRVEQFKPAVPFAMVISRAFSEVALFLKLTRHLCAPGGRWLAMKGIHPQEELSSAHASAETVPLHIPGLQAQRHLSIIPNPASPLFSEAT